MPRLEKLLNDEIDRLASLDPQFKRPSYYNKKSSERIAAREAESNTSKNNLETEYINYSKASYPYNYIDFYQRIEKADSVSVITGKRKNSMTLRISSLSNAVTDS